MEIIYELTEEDYISFNLHHYNNTPSLNKDYNQQRLLFSLAIGIFVLLFVGYFFESWIFAIIIAAIFIAIYSHQFPSIYTGILKKQMNNILQQGDNSSLFSKKTLKIDDETIIVKSKSQTEILSRKYINTIKVYDDMILIYTNGFTAHIIPTRYLINETKDRLLHELGFNR